MPLLTMPMFPPPEFPITREPRYRTADSQFGDGYRLTAKDGINSRTDTVRLEWKVLTLAERNPLYNFLNTVAPATPFIYTGHDGISGVYTCKEWSSAQISPAHWNMSAVLEQFHGY